jgi:hypothetical protein
VIPEDDDLFSFARLRFSPGGDVLAARACARVLLDLCGDGPADPLVLLILTAVCLILHARLGPQMTLGKLRAALAHLGPLPSLAAEMIRSPMQLVRYAGAEIADADPTAVRHAIERAEACVERVASSHNHESARRTKIA